MSRPPVLSRARHWWWRFVELHISGALDRRFMRAHRARYGFTVDSLGCGPFSHPESRWHECVGHDWERIDWPYGRFTRRGYARDRITRCRNCGAPRCDSFHHGGDWPVDDNTAQGYRCTLARHHSEAHDYLSGELIEVGT